MKKGSIVKGLYITGVLDYIAEQAVVVRRVIRKGCKHVFSKSAILIENLGIPTRKEKEEYKKFLLKNGYSYYRGKVIKEL